MPFPLSPHAIDALADVVSGGVNSVPGPVGVYRSGPVIERLMRGCGVDFRVEGSRVPSLTNCLLNLNRSGQHDALTQIIEASCDPGQYADEPQRLDATISHLNQSLAANGFELRRSGARVRLVAAGHAVPLTDALATTVETIDFDTVRLDLDRALESIATDPEDAITAACSALESVCRSILVELGQPLPARKDLGKLYAAVKGPLGLSTDRADGDSEVAGDVTTILGALATMVGGIGSLRTHAGDAHGRERGRVRVDARIARLAVHASSTAALFLIETWQRKFPTQPLGRTADTDGSDNVRKVGG